MARSSRIAPIASSEGSSVEFSQVRSAWVRMREATYFWIPFMLSV